MPSYRFCRPDDIPFLVRAINECWVAHFPGTPRMTVDRFRREMKELDLWPSSCLIALTDTDPIAVLTGTKRETETLVSRLGVRPGHEGNGHGSHLLTSLGQKLAVLGPPRLVAELPAALPRVVRFFEREGWRRETAFTDWLRPAGGDASSTGEVDPVPDGLVAEVTVDDLAAADALEVPPHLDAAPAWERTRESLVGRKGRLRGFAIAGPERIEAWLLELPPEEASDPVEVLGFGAADPERGPLLVRALLRHAIHRHPGAPLRLAKLTAGELPDETLSGLGFRPEAEYHRYSTEAKPL